MKNIILLIAIIFISFLVNGQAKKPTLMVVPSDAWCSVNNCLVEYDNQGTKIRLPDYRKAMLNPELLQVIAKINTLMAERGFPLKDLGAALKSIDADAAESSVSTNKSGASLTESPVDKLKKTAKADIIIQLTYTVNVLGPKKSISYNMQGLDSYTDKQIAGAQGIGAPSFSATLDVLLQEAVLANLDNFNAQLQKHFDDMFANGREITIRIRTYDNWTKNLDDEIGGSSISEIIEDWVKKRAVKGRFSTTDATENMMYLEQVRMPIYDSTGNAMDARGFVRILQRYLGSTKYKIPSKLTIKGLGQATLILGEK